MPASDLERSVEIVGEPWVDSPYYADAEKWTWIFWDPGTVFRTLFDSMDLDVVLELACGHGRHAAQLVGRAKSLILMDLHETNLAVCRNRLGTNLSVRFLRNNGYDFLPLPDSSVSTIFCYDAMVHFSPDIVASYLADTARVLRAGGKALFHHSNYGVLRDNHYGQNPGARNYMTRALFARLANNAGLTVVESTVIDWGGIKELDCISLLAADK